MTLSELPFFALVLAFFARSHAVLPQFPRHVHCLVSAGGISWDGAAEISEIVESFSCGISNFAPSSRGFSAEITFSTLSLQDSPSEQHSREFEDTEDPDGEGCSNCCHAGCDTAW
jgi:hypothetical protein